MAETIVILKLVTGEEVISRVDRDEENEPTVILDRPRCVVVVPGKVPGAMGITLVPFMASNQDGTVALYRTAIVASTKPSSDLEKGYVKNTSTIQLLTE